MHDWRLILNERPFCEILDLYFLMSIFRCVSSFFKTITLPSESPITTYINITKKKKNNINYVLKKHWEMIETIPVYKPPDLQAFALASSLLLHPCRGILPLLLSLAYFCLHHVWYHWSINTLTCPPDTDGTAEQPRS